MADVQKLNTSVPDTNYFSPQNLLATGLAPITGGLSFVFGGGTGRTAKKKWKKAKANYNNQWKNAATNLQNTTNSALVGGDNSDLLNAYLQHINDTFQKTGNSFRGQSTDRLIDSFVNKETERRQNELQNYLDNTYTGFGTTNVYLDDYWKTDADNDFNTQYLDDYYNQSLSQLDTAKNRGLLNDAGYNSALSALDRRRSAAAGEINTMTDDVINGYRDDLAAKVGDFQTAVDDYSLSTRKNNSIDAYKNQFNSLYDSQKTNFENDLNGAVSGFTPFDVADILGNARNTQGILTGGSQNPELLQSLDGSKKQQNKTGLGNQGLF